MQIAGIVGFSFILLEMGEEAFLISALLILGGFCTYWFYGRKRVRTESAVVHLVRRIADGIERIGDEFRVITMSLGIPCDQR